MAKLILSAAFLLLASAPAYAGATADYNAGSAYAKAGKFRDAIPFFDRAISSRPDDFADPYVNKGLCLQKLGYHDRALECYNKALKIQPKLAAVYQNRGTAYYKLNKPAEALKDFDMAIKLPRARSHSSVTIYLDRGRAYAALGRYKEAFQDFDRVRGMKAADGIVQRLKHAADDEYRKAQKQMEASERQKHTAASPLPSETSGESTSTSTAAD